MAVADQDMDPVGILFWFIVNRRILRAFYFELWDPVGTLFCVHFVF